MAERVKIVVKLEKDEDDYPPADYEGLWALPVGEGLFQIDNVPFFARGIAYGDIVSATVEQQELRFQEVVRPSGHSTLRLIVYDEKDIPSVRELLEKLGCDIERSHIPGLISVDVPPTVPLAVLKRHLDEKARPRSDGATKKPVSLRERSSYYAPPSFQVRGGSRWPSNHGRRRCWKARSTG